MGDHPPHFKQMARTLSTVQLKRLREGGFDMTAIIDNQRTH